jgi:predicted amidohydrolase
MRLAACKYPFSTLETFADFAQKQQCLLQEAKDAGAEWAVLPEYLALELAGTLSPAARSDPASSLAALQPLWPAWQNLYASTSRSMGMWILAGTFLLADGQGRYRNRALLASPQGHLVYADKHHLTAFEQQLGLLAEGADLPVVRAGAACASVAVCYDSEFPLLVRAQREAGANLLLVPSCTDTAAGANRVRVGCSARALENRLAVVCATTSGDLPWSPFLDAHSGEAAVLVPMDTGLPQDGIAAQTQGADRWALADIDLAALRQPSAGQQVNNDQDWRSQYRIRPAT